MKNDFSHLSERFYFSLFLKSVTLHIFAKFWFSSEWCLTMFPPVFCFTDNLLCVSALLNEVTLKYLQLRALWVLWILRKGASVLPWLPPSPEDTLKCPSSKSSKLSHKQLWNQLYAAQIKSDSYASLPEKYIRLRAMSKNQSECHV